MAIRLHELFHPVVHPLREKHPISPSDAPFIRPLQSRCRRGFRCNRGVKSPSSKARSAPPESVSVRSKPTRRWGSDGASMPGPGSALSRGIRTSSTTAASYFLLRCPRSAANASTPWPPLRLARRAIGILATHARKCLLRIRVALRPPATQALPT